MENLLTKEDIEKFGFIYEPDESKCKLRKIKMHFDCNYYKDGEWTNRTTPIVDDEWKKRCGEVLKAEKENWSVKWTHLHSVGVADLKPMSGEGVACRWVMIQGHDMKKLSNEEIVHRWNSTGLLDGLTEEDRLPCSLLLNNVADLLIGKFNERMKKIDDDFYGEGYMAGTILPVARRLYNKNERPKIIPSAEWLFEDYEKFLLENKSLYKDLKQGIACDGEAEFVTLYVTDVVKRKKYVYKSFRRMPRF